MKTKQEPVKEDQKLWLIIGAATLVLGGIGYWYYRKRKQKENQLLFPSNDEIPTTSNTIRNTAVTTRFRCKNREYPLAYGTCHKDVETLQRYLQKIYKANLGSSGRRKDGVDGMFGNKTNKAAKIHLGKTSFSKQDIEGMETAIKTIRR